MPPRRREPDLSLEMIKHIPDPGETPFEQATASLDAEMLHTALAALPNERYRDVLVKRYGIDSPTGDTMVFREIGQSLRVSSGRANQLHQQALSCMRRLGIAQGLQEPLGPVKPLTPLQEARQASVEQQRSTKILLGKQAVQARQDIGEDQLFNNIKSETNFNVASLAYLVLQRLFEDYRLNSSYDVRVVVDKHELARQIEQTYLSQYSEGSHINHVDYIRALNALESQGIINCYRNERNSVINKVTLRIPRPQTGPLISNSREPRELIMTPVTTTIKPQSAPETAPALVPHRRLARFFRKYVSKKSH
jgi:hypothetical protein